MVKVTRSVVPFLSLAALWLAAGAAAAQVQAMPPQQVPQTGADDARPLTDVDVQGLRTLQAITSRSLQGLTFEQRGDGTLGIDLQGRFQHVLMATPGPGGSLTVACHSSDSATAATATPMPPWSPSRGDRLYRLDVSGLIAALPAVVSTTPVLEEK